MYGVVEGLMRCQEGRVEDLNKRIASRNKPGGNLQSTFSTRPVPTRYVKIVSYFTSQRITTISQSR